MCAPIPKNKWSWKYAECKRCKTQCKTGKHKHKGNGLCLACFDKNRAKNPKRAEALKAQNDKYYAKVKNDTKYKKMSVEKTVKWQKENPNKHKAAWRRRNLKDKYRRIIRNQKENKGRILKRNQGLKYRCDGCPKECLITSPIDSTNLGLWNTSERETGISDLQVFRKIVIEECNL